MRIMTDSLLREYTNRCETWSNIYEHLPVLKRYSNKCNHVTEFGVWKANSSIGLMAGLPKTMRSYDIREFSSVTTQLLYDLASENNIDYRFKIQSSIEIIIDQTDLLFIDSLHLYEHLKKELEMHHTKVNKYMIFHDTVECATSGMDIKGKRYPNKGLMIAIEEFLLGNQEWVIKEHFMNNYGLLVLKRREQINS